MEKTVKFFVIGCGSIGERHIKNLNSLSAGSILAHDVNCEQLRLIKEKYTIETYDDIEDGFNQKPDAVLVCTPPNMHIPVAIKAVDHNAHVFIEKPISHNLEKVDELISKAKSKNLNILVGYNLRFHSGIQLIKKMIDDEVIGKVLSAKAEFGQYLPDWRPSLDYRKSYSAIKELGGGIILDASHEIDYLQWLIGDIKKVACFADKISDLDVNVEDTAEILLKFENNAIGGIHLDFTQRNYSRNCKIIGEKGTIIWDYSGKNVKLYSAREKQWKNFPIKTDANDMYIQEMKHFIDCINGKTKPLIDASAAKKVLEIALSIKESAKKSVAISI